MIAAVASRKVLGRVTDAAELPRPDRAAWHRRRHEAARAARERDLHAQLADSLRREQEARAALDGVRDWPRSPWRCSPMGARPQVGRTAPAWREAIIAGPP